MKEKDQKLSSIIKVRIERERMEMFTEVMENQRLESILKRLDDDYASNEKANKLGEESVDISTVIDK